MAQNLRRLKPGMTFTGYQIHLWLKEIIKEEKKSIPISSDGETEVKRDIAYTSFTYVSMLVLLIFISLIVLATAKLVLLYQIL